MKSTKGQDHDATQRERVKAFQDRSNMSLHRSEVIGIFHMLPAGQIFPTEADKKAAAVVEL